MAKRMLRFSAWFAPSLILLLASAASASLIFDHAETLSGTGLGAVFTVLTIQNTPSESGCVAFDGTNDVIGASACPAGISGGDEKAAKTMTRALSDVGLTDAVELRIVFNGAETDHALILNKLVLTIFSPSGAVVFTTGAFTAVDFTDLIHGVGGAGQVFRLDPTQVAAANTVNAFSNPANRIGLAATAGDGSGTQQTENGPETFFVTKFGCPPISITPTSLPIGTVSTAYPTTNFTATGGTAPITWTESGDLAGLTFADNGNNTASLSGIPTSVGTFPITVTATDTNGCKGIADILLIINPTTCMSTVVTINPLTIPNGTIGSFYTQGFTASGGTAPYTFSADLDGAPLGLSFDAISAILSGVPTEIGSFSVTIAATDANGCTGDREYSFAVGPTRAVTPAPAVTPPALALLALALVGGGLGVISRKRRRL